MACTEISADTYDLYVLGLLEGPELAYLERHLADECAECVAGLRRSLDLWVVFASTLEESEPSNDLRARMVRLADMSKKVLKFPKPAISLDQGKHNLRWWLTSASAVMAMLIVGAWYAGHQSGSIEAQRLSGELNHLTQEVAATQVLLETETSKRQKAEAALKTSGESSVVDRVESMRHQVLELQAQVNQYKTAIQRQQGATSDNIRILNVLASPGIHLVAMKGAELAASSTAYMLFDQARAIFVASNLPKLSEEKQFQLWLIRKQESKVVNAGIVSVGEDNRAVFEVNNAPSFGEVALIAITDEPKGGSAAPTGTKLLVGSTSEE